MATSSEGEMEQDNSEYLMELMRNFNKTKCKYTDITIRNCLPKDVKEILKDPCTCKVRNGRAECEENCIYRVFGIECRGHNCSNQRVSRDGMTENLEIFQTAEMGVGVRTRIAIEKGSFVMSYIGEVMTEEKYKGRLKHTAMSYGVRLKGCEPKIICDPLYYGNVAKFCNHHCSANMVLRISYIDGKPVPTLWAKRRIDAMEELCFDYCFENYGKKEFVCRCGADNCIEKREKIKEKPVVRLERIAMQEEVTWFWCVVCKDAKFSSEKQLKQHQFKVHKIAYAWSLSDAVIKAQTCTNIDCRSFNTTYRCPSSYMNHLPSHSNRKREMCEVCDKMYKSMTSLLEHVRNVHGPKLPKDIRI